MAQQTIGIGTVANDGTGDTLRDAGDKINDNFTELYAADAALGTAAPLDIDTDDTLAANSDSLIPTQQAVKAYVDANAGGTEATAADFRTGTQAGEYISPDVAFDAAATVALTPGTNVATDMATGFNFTLAMGGNYTLDNPTNPKVGQTGFIQITQDGTGSRTLAYGTNWKFAGGTDPVLSTAASSVDVLFYQVLTSTSIVANLVKAIA